MAGARLSVSSVSFVICGVSDGAFGFLCFVVLCFCVLVCHWLLKSRLKSTKEKPKKKKYYVLHASHQEIRNIKLRKYNNINWEAHGTV